MRSKEDKLFSHDIHPLIRLTFCECLDPSIYSIFYLLKLFGIFVVFQQSSCLLDECISLLGEEFTEIFRVECSSFFRSPFHQSFFEVGSQLTSACELGHGEDIADTFVGILSDIVDILYQPIELFAISPTLPTEKLDGIAFFEFIFLDDATLVWLDWRRIVLKIGVDI